MYNFSLKCKGVVVDEGSKFMTKGRGKNKPTLQVVELNPIEVNSVAVFDGKSIDTMRLDLLVLRYRKVS